MTKGNVLVTGASGYIAGFCIKLLVEEGWSVRGTIRNLAKADATRNALGLSAEQLPLVAADLMSDAGWAEAAAGCDYVLHIASPIPAQAPKHEDELIVPARDGALRLLKAARDAGVKRVVMTSSAAAICYGSASDGKVFTEADWTNPDGPGVYPYIKSKTIAERAARDWVAAEGGALELVTINPTAVLGPVQGADVSPSLLFVGKLLDGSMPGLPRLGFCVIDVRDVALAHVRAMTADGMANERFLAAGDWMWMEDVGAVLKARLGDRAKKVPSRRLPNWLVRVFALFDAEIRTVTSELGRERRCDSRHMQTVLGVVPRPVEETIVDTARGLFAEGLVKA